MTGWNAFGTTDVGLVRARNEDAFAVDDDIGCYLVADGLGGSPGGDVASAMARDIVLDTLRRNRGSLADDAANVLGRAVRAANAAILYVSSHDPTLTGMGTTLSVLWLGANAGQGWIAQIGDSRVYRHDAKGLTQITEDHTFAMASVRAGLINLEEARISPGWHALTRAVGVDAEVEADIIATDTGDTDAYLLCSDGLTGMVDDGEIDRLLSAHASDPRAACEALINAAVFNGGRDNVTVVVAYRRPG
jgi:protein phosphatase